MYKSDKLKYNIINFIKNHNANCKCKDCQKYDNFYTNKCKLDCNCNKCINNKSLFSSKYFKFN